MALDAGASRCWASAACRCGLAAPSTTRPCPCGCCALGRTGILVDEVRSDLPSMIETHAPHRIRHPLSASRAAPAGFLAAATPPVLKARLATRGCVSRVPARRSPVQTTANRSAPWKWASVLTRPSSSRCPPCPSIVLSVKFAPDRGGKEKTKIGERAGSFVAVRPVTVAFFYYSVKSK